MDVVYSERFNNSSLSSVVSSRLLRPNTAAKQSWGKIKSDHVLCLTNSADFTKRKVAATAKHNAQHVTPSTQERKARGFFSSSATMIASGGYSRNSNLIQGN